MTLEIFRVKAIVYSTKEIKVILTSSDTLKATLKDRATHSYKPPHVSRYLVLRTTG